MSKVQGKAGGSYGMDRTAFYGVRVPTEIKAMVKPLKKLDKGSFRKILKIIVAVLNGKQPTFESISPLISDTLNEETLAVLYSGIDRLVRLALRVPSSSLKKEHLLQDLQDLQMPEEFQEDIASCVLGAARGAIDSSLVERRPRLPSLASLGWRVDVAISTGVLNRVLVRGVTVDMATSDGNIHNFEMSVDKFHDLRFHVATVLNEMERLEKRSILKIKD